MRKAVMTIEEFSVNRTQTVVLLVVILTAFFAAQFARNKIDTDPENMLRGDVHLSAFHQQVKKDFSIEEMIVLGIIREDGIFHSDSLERIKRLTNEIIRVDGVVADDLLSLSVTNNVVLEAELSL